MILRPLIFLAAFALSFAAQAQTRDSLLNDGFQPISCIFSERCSMGQACVARTKQLELLYSGTFRMLFLDEAGKGMTVATPVSRQGDPVFLALIEDGKQGMLTIHDRGFAVLSAHTTTSPPAGYFLRGTCDRPGS